MSNNAGGFQTSVQNQPAPAIAGDFSDVNPRYTYDAGPGGLVAGASGVTVGRFAWAVNPNDADGTPSIVNSFGSGPVSGFVAREQQALITKYLDGASMLIAPGFMVTLFTGGGFWVVNDGAGLAVPGQKAYAGFADGKVSFAATGTPTAGGTSTASTIAAKEATVTASLLNDVLTVTVAGGDPIVPGAILASGAGVVAGTSIVSQVTPLLSGEALGGVGRYIVSIGFQTVASEAMTFDYGLLTIGGSVVASYGVGDVLATTGGVTAGTKITGLGTGVGVAGTYYVTPTQTVGSGAINTLAVNVETKWIAMSTAQPGALIKISDKPLG